MSEPDVLDELSNETRRRILSLLSIEPRSFTDVAKLVELSNSEVSRHLNRMSDRDLVVRDEGRHLYDLSAWGRTILGAAHPLLFLLENQSFFRGHPIDYLPPDLLLGIDALAEATPLKGTGAVMAAFKEVTESSEDWVDLMVDQPFPFGKPGLRARYIVPPSLMSLKPAMEKQNRAMDGRFHPEVHMSLVLSGAGEGILNLPDASGRPDYSYAFRAGDGQPRALAYMRRVWDHYWATGESP